MGGGLGVAGQGRIGDYQALEDVRFVRKRREAGETAYSKNNDKSICMVFLFRGPFQFREPLAPLPGLAAGTFFVGEVWSCCPLWETCMVW